MAELSFLTDGSHEQVVYVTHRAARRPGSPHCRPTCRRPSPRPSPTRASARCSATSAASGTCWPPAATWSSRPAPRAASRCRSRCRPSNALPNDPHSRALFLYPTKALAQDQARKLAGLRVAGAVAALYDGDTPQAQRAPHQGRRHDPADQPRHAARGHTAGARPLGRVPAPPALRRARRGARVPRRVRLARRAGRAPAAPALRSLRRPSPVRAGLGDHRQPASRSPSGWSACPSPPSTTTVLHNPSRPSSCGTRRSPTSPWACARAPWPKRATCSPRSCSPARRTIDFAPTRKAAELVYGYTRRRIEERDPPAAERIMPYRAGYTPQQRRDIERRLFGGELRAVVATSALELGIDVGSLDVALVTGFPGTMTSLWQRWGRAGRAGKGWAVLVAGQDALDQYFMREPERLLSRGRRRRDRRSHQPAHPRGAPLRRGLRAAARERDETYFGAVGMARAGQLAAAASCTAARPAAWSGRSRTPPRRADRPALRLV